MATETVEVELREGQVADSRLLPPPRPRAPVQEIFIVAAATTIIFTACGINFAFGVFQELYESMSHDPTSPFYGASPAVIDLIGTISIALMTIGAPFATAWTKRYPPRLVTWAGGCIFCFALVLASFCQRIWQFELAQGALVGVGTCLLYMPAVTVTPPWFSARRGLAMGIVLSGTGIGGVAWAPALRALINAIGFRNTLRFAGGVSFVLTILAGYMIKWDPVTLRRIEAENASGTPGLFKVPLVNWRIARSRKFLAQAFSTAFQSAAYYTPVFFFASYARTLGYSQATSANFIALCNAANAIGKIAIGHLADRLGRINALFITTALSAVAALALWLPSSLSTTQADGRAFFIAFTVMYGIFASAYVSLFPTSLVELFGVQHFASVNGILYMLRGMATLVGTPVAGALIRKSSTHQHPDSYLSMSIMVGSLLAAREGEGMEILGIRTYIYLPSIGVSYFVERTDVLEDIDANIERGLEARLVRSSYSSVALDGKAKAKSHCGSVDRAPRRKGITAFSGLMPPPKQLQYKHLRR
ncbi:hypothetical protein DV736_g3654, partial [Chaetothyriales sp. CBS 134916]